MVFKRYVSRPTVLVVAVPQVCASALAFYLREAGVYDVHAPDVARGEPVPGRRFDAVLTTVPVPEAVADVVVELPQSFDSPVLVTVNGATFPVSLGESNPIEDVVVLLRRYVLEGERPSRSFE